MHLLYLNCVYYFWTHVFIIIEFMYLFNSCIYYFLIHVFIFEYMYLLFWTIKLFLCFYFRKMVSITGRASTFLEIFENSNLNPN